MRIIALHLMVWCVFGFVTVKCHGNSYTVTASPASATVAPGTTHTMHCQYTIAESPEAGGIRLNWFKTPPGGMLVGVWFIAVYSSGAVIINLPGSGYTRLSGSSPAFSALLTGHSLTITDVEREDEGEYRCGVNYWTQNENEDDMYDASLAIRLNVEANLQVQIHGSSPLHVGETLSLTCTTAQEGVNPAFAWTFTPRGQSPQVVSYAKTYTKQRVESLDAGDYTCEASTANTTGKASIAVVVQETVSPTPGPTPAPTQEAISSTPMTVSISDPASTAIPSRTSTPVLSSDPPRRTYEEDPADGTLNIGALIGGSVGGALVLFIIIAFSVSLILLLRRQKH